MQKEWHSHSSALFTFSWAISHFQSVQCRAGLVLYDYLVDLLQAGEYIYKYTLQLFLGYIYSVMSYLPDVAL